MKRKMYWIKIMMDSIALNLQPHEFEIMDHAAFTPSARGLFVPPYYELKRGGFACVNNPSRSSVQQYGYMPRLTLYKRPQQHGFRIGLRVDASLPKLKHGNNFDELMDADLDFLCNRVAQQMERMKVRVSAATLRQASVSSIHYSKNLPLTDYTRCSMVIKEIAKGSVSRQLDSVKTDYRNDGSAIRFHASSHEVIVYDKLKDLQRGKVSDKRAIEKNNEFQLSLLDQPFPKQLEVLRLEARLGKRQKIKAILQKLGYDRPLTLEGLFSSELAQAVLLDYWRMITPDVPLLAASGFPSAELFDAVLREQPGIKPTQALQIVGALAIIQREGMEGLRTHLEAASTTRAWYRLKRQLNGLNITSHLKYNALQVAEQHLQEFKPLRLDDYQL